MYRKIFMSDTLEKIFQVAGAAASSAMGVRDNTVEVELSVGKTRQ